VTMMPQLVEALLDAMPLPPGDASVDEILAAFAMMRDRCAAILDAIDDADIDRSEPRIAELRARQAAWADALAAARDLVRQQHAGAAKLRNYAQAL
jgi:hypothetical protein